MQILERINIYEHLLLNALVLSFFFKTKEWPLIMAKKATEFLEET